MRRWTVVLGGVVIGLALPAMALGDEPGSGWGFDGEEQAIADTTWGVKVSAGSSHGCSQSWESSSYQGHWVLEVASDVATLSLELSGTSIMGSRQGGSTTVYDIPERHWMWSGTVVESEDGVELNLNPLSAGDRDCPGDGEEAEGFCTQAVHPMVLTCSSPELHTLPEGYGPDARTADRTILRCGWSATSQIAHEVILTLDNGTLVLARGGLAELEVLDEMLGGAATLTAIIPSPAP